MYFLLQNFYKSPTDAIQLGHLIHNLIVMYHTFYGRHVSAKRCDTPETLESRIHVACVSKILKATYMYSALGDIILK